jgi:hypothetical protein
VAALMGRISQLDDPLVGDAKIDEFVEHLASGATQPTIAEAMGVSTRLIRDWKKREDVQQRLTKVLRERVNRVRSLTDAELVKRLENAERRGKLSVDQLLKIQAASPLDEADDKGDAASILKGLMEAAAGNPDLARALQDVLPGGSDGR